MATKKDLVEAQAFGRRRLTTALVSGAPGGREVEPDRPLRAVAGGAALSVVLVLASMAFGWLRSSLPEDWADARLVVAEDSGARYVSIDGVLHPVLNTTSARLLIPAGEFEVLSVPDTELADIERGPTLGIPGAPDSLPAPDRLVGTGWRSCLTGAAEVSTVVGPDRGGVPADGRAVLVRSGEQTFVVAGGRRHPVAARDLSAVSVALRLDGRPALPAPAAWVDLFPEGPALAPLRVDGLGAEAPGLPAGATVGSVLELGGEGTRHYLVTPRGDLEPLPEVALAMYRLGSGASASPIPVEAAQIARLEVRPQRVAPAEWPDRLPTVLDGTPCATLSAAPGEPPGVALSTLPDDTAGEEPGRASVATGHGALVRAVGGDALARGPVLVLDQTGTAYAVEGADDDVLARLGYGPDQVVPVPQAWAALFRSGPTLGTRAARTEVTEGA